MHLSGLILFSAFTLACTRNLNGAARRLTIQAGYIAAMAVLLAALSAFEWTLGANASAFPAGFVLLVLGVWAARRAENAYSVPLAAFFAGLLGWLLTTLLPDAAEAGALLALPAALLARALYKSPRAGLLLVLLSPLFYSVFAALSEWYYFGYAYIALFDATQFDAQLCGALFYALLLYVPLPKLHNREIAQKEA